MVSGASIVRTALTSAAFAAALFACTLTRSLDYLTAGVGGELDGGDGGGGGGGGTDAPGGSGGGTGDTIASGQLGPRNLTQDDANLYWSNADGAIMTAPKAGGAARKIASAPPRAEIRWLSADPGTGGHLWVIAGPAVHRVSKEGGELELVEDETPMPHALAVDDDYLFVAHFEEFGMEFGRLVRFSKRQLSNRVVLSDANDEPAAVALHGGSVFWSGLLPNGARVVFEVPRDASAGAGARAKVYGAPEDDGQFTLIWPDTAAGFAVDDEAVYYLELEEGAVIYRLPRDEGATPTEIFAPPREGKPRGFAFDGTNLYVVDERENGAIVRVPKKGGDFAPIASNLRVPTSVVADSSFVYFTVQGSGYEPDGAVLRAAK